MLKARNLEPIYLEGLFQFVIRPPRGLHGCMAELRTENNCTWGSLPITRIYHWQIVSLQQKSKPSVAVKSDSNMNGAVRLGDCAWDFKCSSCPEFGYSGSGGELENWTFSWTNFAVLPTQLVMTSRATCRGKNYRYLFSRFSRYANIKTRL